jgi:transposase
LNGCIRIRGNVKNGHPDVSVAKQVRALHPRKEPAMKSLGLDAHSASFTLAVLTPLGKLSSCLSNTTSAQNLIDAVTAVSGPKVLVVEESHLAQWVKRTLQPYVDKLVICDPQRNAWIAKDEFADDKSSALKLAKLQLDGYIKEIRHPEEAGAKLRSLFLHYYDLNQQLTRFKNKLKAVFRSEAIATGGKGIYKEDAHGAWLKKLKGQGHLQHTARQRFELVDTLEKLKDETYAAMVKLAKKQKAFELIDGMPGAGPVIACGYIALIDTPHRFSKKNRLWKYACLANKYHQSDEAVYENAASSSGNRVLKWVVVEHFMHAVEQSRTENRFKRQYEGMLKKGTDKTAARRQVCRALLSAVRAMWIKEEAYRDKP